MSLYIIGFWSDEGRFTLLYFLLPLFILIPPLLTNSLCFPSLCIHFFKPQSVALA